MAWIWAFILLLVVLYVYSDQVFGYCNRCGRWFVYPKTRRQNTQYADDSDNFVRCCYRCFARQEELWAERWREYWSERL